MDNENTLRASRWANKEQWGWSYDTYIELVDAVDFLKAILLCTKGDGVISPKEREWVLGFAASREMPTSVIEEVESYSGDEDIADVLSRSGIVESGKKGTIYWAIKACSADGEYPEAEKNAVRKMAVLMGISEQVVKEIEEVIIEEQKLRDKRNSLVYDNKIFWQDN
ncbi:hypothetical protein ACP6PL_19215 [Dapis sp. BLCC M126]|uniref:hypothetical protein n=1 Tax=Dapis sp. BLCC M126 TaxID=3400189 RepID=UPI003CE96BF5